MVKWITFKDFVGKEDTWHVSEANEPQKGAFKHLPLDQQPQRIPIAEYPEAAKWVQDNFGKLGRIFIPDATKKAFGRDTTGDLDVIIEPTNRNTWKDDILALGKPFIVAHVTNGPQIMTVMNLPNGRRFMIDFILAKPGSFEYRAKYAQFGTILPAVVGSFARSLGYKFDQNSLQSRIQDEKGNYHNIMLTNDFYTALKILMLDPLPVKEGKRYTPQDVAKWVTDSPRFDTDLWKKPHVEDGITIVVRNHKSHGAAKKKPEVVQTYKLIDQIDKKATWDNTGFKIERQVLGNDFVDKFLLNVKSIVQKSRRVLSGDEIIKTLGIKPGPDIAKWIQYLNEHPSFKHLSQEELDKPETKAHARAILMKAILEKPVYMPFK